jgi:mono/diheme cytochrome c family protein
MSGQKATGLAKVADGFEALAAVAVVIFVILLFTNSPTPPPQAPEEAVEQAGGIDGAAVYGDRCAGCHGGDGSGGIGPRLAGRMVERFPDPAQQVDVVTNGRGGMPAFGNRLGAEEIGAVVEYTRTVLGG